MSLVSPICGSAHRCLGSWFLLAEVASNPCHAQTISFCRAVKGVTRATAEDPESACMCKTAVHMQIFQGYPLALSPIQQLLIFKILNKEAKEGHVDDIKQFFVNQLYAAHIFYHTLYHFRPLLVYALPRPYPNYRDTAQMSDLKSSQKRPRRPNR
ncbi:hypothetical protein NCU02721 [Neurospora crassa OR74A]|uniref:Uncharacterized protein n=1 Tax=Neurospora crassa (strain ATCC 24698 / 74-OR23-1A / CBS 708.71 / DSM 1257 / FGSC 987) TaxID=367110 RepID=Q7SGC8_NEUCR|nr:hypothetical protein NCU02721 [Neurospora crassa OR74A]EAA35870.1 hypothetical protein NCU02721 [Neurospora crassa OR74A]|eukprot:XP_965106.1 hypothetical protein NCU02721 [Neurospora crassa OR74A]